MNLCRIFYIALEKGQGRIGYISIFQLLTLFQVVAFNCILMSLSRPVLVQDTARVKGFCIRSVWMSFPTLVYYVEPHRPFIWASIP